MLTSSRSKSHKHIGNGTGEDESEVVNIVDDEEPNEWPVKEEMRNIELEKELEKRMKRREGYSDKDKVYKYSAKDNKHKGETYRKGEGEYHEDGNRGYKHKEERYRDDVERDHRHKTGRARDDVDRKRSRDYASEFESKKLKDGRHRHTISDDQAARHKDNKDVRRDNSKNKDESRDYISRNIQDQHLDSKRYINDAKIDRNCARGISSPRNDDTEITTNHSRRSSPNCKYYPSRDHQRVSKQEETKYRDVVHEDTARLNSDLSDKVCADDQLAERLETLSSRNKISSHLPPQPPFKTGSGSLLGFGFSGDDRGKLIKHNWKSGDPNLGRTQTTWNHFPNWRYAPPPMFNPFVYQSVPPMFGGPPMNMNNATIPYHFNRDGYGNWDHGRTELNDQSWESNVVSVDLQSSVQQNEDSFDGHMDEVRSGETGPHIENEEKSQDFNNPGVMKVTESSYVSMVEKDDDTLISRFYLSKIDVSRDLTRPELYERCRSILLDFDEAESDECDCKILFLKEGVEHISNIPSIFAAVDDSISKKAMSLYTKQKVCVTAMGSQSFEDQVKESCTPSVDFEVKVKDSCNNHAGSKEVDKPGGGGSLLGLTNVLTNDLIEFGPVNLSRIHSLESTH